MISVKKIREREMSRSGVGTEFLKAEEFQKNPVKCLKQNACRVRRRLAGTRLAGAQK